MNYPMYNNSQFYMQNLQDMRDRIDNQIKNYQQSQMQQQPVQPITQNFQLAPQTNNNELESKYANNIDEVKNIFVMKTGVFVNKEMNTLWFKNVNGDIRTFNLQEIIEQDEKDLEIQRLRNEIENMKGMIANVQSNADDNSKIDGTVKSKATSKLSSTSKNNAK